MQSYLHSESEGLYISIIKRSRNTYIFIARSIKFPSFAFNLKFLAFLLPLRFSLRPSKILCIKKRRNCGTYGRTFYPWRGLKFTGERSGEEQVSSVFFRYNRRGISFSKEEGPPRVAGIGTQGKKQMLQNRVGSIKYNNRRGFSWLNEPEYVT